MIAFGCAVTDDALFERHALPVYRAAAEPDSLIIVRRGAPSIQTAYNEILAAVDGLEDLEALVLIHQDVSLDDPETLLAKTRGAMADPTVMLAGAYGSRASQVLGAWEGITIGDAPSPGLGVHTVEVAARSGEVDGIDGFALVFSPRAVHELRFDRRFGPLHGYDADISLQAREAGGRVVVIPLAILHHTDPGHLETSAGEFREAAARLERKWGLRRPVPFEPPVDDDPGPQPILTSGRELATMFRPDHSLRLTSREADFYDWGPLDLDANSTYGKQATLLAGHRRLLEVGCGPGRMSAELQARGHEVTGLELDAGFAALARTRCDRVIEADLEHDDIGEMLRGETFDAIVAGDVLEHLRDPHSLLVRLRPLLADDGILVISVPNVANEAVRLALMQGEFPYAPVGLLDRTHLRFFTPRLLDQMLVEAGFAVDQILPVTEAPPLGGELYDRERVSPEVREMIATDPSASWFQIVVSARPADDPQPGRLIHAAGSARAAERQRTLATRTHGAVEALELQTRLEQIESTRAWRAVRTWYRVKSRLVRGSAQDQASAPALPALAGGDAPNGTPEDPSTLQDVRERYVELVKLAVLDLAGAGTSSIDRDGVRVERPIHDPLRTEGNDWPAHGLTMIGRRRLDQLHEAVERILADDIPGDLIEAGVWRGGACMTMKAVLRAHGDTRRRVVLADSFSGVPEPVNKGGDAGDDLHLLSSILGVPRSAVEEHFERYGLLDDRVEFVEGLFVDTMPALAGRTWSLIRLDGDLHDSLIPCLEHLYPGVSPAGYVIIDDYGGISQAARAVDEFRATHGITEELRSVDGSGVFWRRAR